MKDRFRRPLAESERLWLGLNRAIIPFVNQAVIEGRGSMDFQALEHAVEKASEANPGSRLVLKGVLRGCYWIDSGKTPRIRIIKDGTWDGYGSDNAPFLLDDLPASGPTCEVVYIEGNTPRIVFRTNHAVMDGRGTLTWMEDIFRVLRGECPVGSSSTISDYELIRSLSDKKIKINSENNIAPTGRPGQYTKGVTWKRITLHGKHANLVGTIAVILAKSAWKYQDGGFKIAVPVDLRRRMEGLRSTGNLSMTIYVDVKKDSTPKSISEEIQRQLDAKNDCVNIERGNYLDMVPLWVMGLFCKLVLKIVHKKKFYTFSACISNLGKIDMGKVSGGGFSAESIFFIPPRMDSLPAFVVLAGCSDRAELTLSVPNILGDNGRMDMLLDDIRSAFQ